MLFEKKDRIVFTGDSVTDMDRLRPIGEGFDGSIGYSYVAVIQNLLYAVYPELGIRVTNTGVSGNTSRDLLARFQEDVCDLDPDWVSICIGINDVWRQFDSPAMVETQVMPDEYERNLTEMLERLKTKKLKGVFLLSPYIIEPLREDKMRARMDEYVEICRKLSEKYGCIFIDFQKLYEDYCNACYSAYICWDRIHPNQIGATLMAMRFLEVCGFEYGHNPMVKG